MPSLIDIRRRIRAVKSTQQITKAMKMVAASRMRRAHDRVVSARPYSKGLLRVLTSLASRVDSNLHALLAERDPGAARAVHANDRRRVVRALELAEAGETLAPASSQLWEHEPRHPTVVFGLEVDPDVVRRRIELRTAAMFDRGVEDEVRAALGGPLSSTAARIHGLQDVAALLRGEIDRDEAARRLIVRTRRYAKRQRVWMRRLPGLVPVGSAAEMAERL